MLRAGPTEGRVPSARRQQSQRPRGHRRVQPLADTRCRIRARTRLDWSGPPERCCIGEDRVMLPATRLYHHRLPASEAPAAKPMPARGTTPGDGTHPTEAFSLLPDERDARLRSGSGSALLFATRAGARDALSLDQSEPESPVADPARKSPGGWPRRRLARRRGRRRRRPPFHGSRAASSSDLPCCAPWIADIRGKRRRHQSVGARPGFATSRAPGDRGRAPAQ